MIKEKMKINEILTLSKLAPPSPTSQRSMTKCLSAKGIKKQEITHTVGMFWTEGVNIANLRLVFLEVCLLAETACNLDFAGFLLFPDKSKSLCLDFLFNNVVYAKHLLSFRNFGRCQIEGAYIQAAYSKPWILHPLHYRALPPGKVTHC